MLMCCRGLSYHDAAKMVEGCVGQAKDDELPEPKDMRKIREGLKRIRAKCRPADAPVIEYLASRHLSPTPAIKSARLEYWHDGVSYGEFDAMVCEVTAIDGRPATFHLTYLADGKKADVQNARKMRTPALPTRGGAIRLSAAGEVLGVAEGIETALSASAMFGVPVWSCVSAGLLEQFQPPECVRELVIYGDNDASNTGQAASFALAKRMTAKGLECRVEIPPTRGDWNDVLLSEKTSPNV